MTCNISGPARFFEAPPLYTARPSDPEVASIRSEAPSYRSQAPSYHSETTGLPTTTTYRSSTQISTHSTRQASSNHNSRDTWRSARSQLSDVDVRAYSIPTWSNVRSHQERTLLSVAHRRAVAAAAATAISSPPARGSLRVRLPPTNCEEVILEEDPYLVGTEAANQARKERLTSNGDEDTLLQEDKAWNFMLGQMSDWEARERSWQKFRKESSRKPGFLRRRLAVLGTGKW